MFVLRACSSLIGNDSFTHLHINFTHPETFGYTVIKLKADQPKFKNVYRNMNISMMELLLFGAINSISMVTGLLQPWRMFIL